jgi:hypothetical protein
MEQRMIELHERLSEFSYGYGVTREVERLLSDVGVRTVPFMPSLIQEKVVGFDVGFSGRGVPLLLQFKLGQSLKRFVRTDKASPAPLLERPFFRFSIDTAEPDGQFETLLRAEMDGAETYYVAPRFTDWPQYINFFEASEVLQRSVMVTPGEIRAALVAKGLPDGAHRIVYDRDSVHVCSTPIDVRDVRPETLTANVLTRLRSEGPSLGQAIHQIYDGLEDRSTIRRPIHSEDQSDEPEEIDLELTKRALDERTPPQVTRPERVYRLTQLRERSRSEEDAIAAALGLEFWALGIQLLFAFEGQDATQRASSRP